MNKDILFKKINVFSQKLKKEIELDAYEQDDKLILSTNGLISYFNSILKEYGIKIEKTVEKISINEDGFPVYCLCKFSIIDKDGYAADFFGESTPETRTSDIARKNPFVIAENRATSRGIIQYLQLPKKAYSDTEIEIPATKDDIKEIIEKTGKKETEKQGLITSPVESAGDIKESVDAYEENATENTVDNTVCNTEKELTEDNVTEETSQCISHADNNKEAPVEEKNIEESHVDKSGATTEIPETKTENGNTSIEMEKSNSKESASLNEADLDLSVEGLDLVIFFGPGKGRNITVRQALTSPEFANFVDNIKKGLVKKPTDEKRAAVVRAILKATKVYTPEWDK